MKQLVIMLLCTFILVACSNEEDTNKEPNNDDSQQSEESASVEFRNIDVKIGKNTIQVNGEAKATDETIYFKFEQGETVLANETAINLEKNEKGWGSFNIEVELSPKVSKTKKIPLITLYDKNKDGKVINQNYIPINLVEQEK